MKVSSDKVFCLFNPLVCSRIERDILCGFLGVKNVDVDLDNQVVRILGSSPVKTMTEALEQTGRKARLIGQGVPDGMFQSYLIVSLMFPQCYRKIVKHYFFIPPLRG